MFTLLQMDCIFNAANTSRWCWYVALHSLCNRHWHAHRIDLNTQSTWYKRVFIWKVCRTITKYSCQQHCANPETTKLWDAMISEATGTLTQQITITFVRNHNLFRSTLNNPHLKSWVTFKSLDKTEIFIRNRQNKHAQVKRWLASLKSKHFRTVRTFHFCT